MNKKEKAPKPWEVDEATQTTQDVAFYAPKEPSEGQEETAMLPAEVDYGDLISSALQKKKKKRSPKTILIICIAAGLVVLFLFQLIWGMLQGPAPTYAEVETVMRGDIYQTLSTSGPIRSADKRVVYAPASAPISELNVALGDVVRSGESLVSFDTLELERSVETAGASVQQTSLQRQESQQASAEASQSAADYQNSLTTMRQQRDIANIRLVQAQDNLAVVSANISPTLAAKQAQLDSMRTQQTSLLTSDSAAAVALQPQIDALATEVAGLEGQIASANTTVSAAQADVEYHNSIVSQLESAVTQAESGILSPEAAAQLQSQMVAPQNTLDTAQEQLNAALEGVSAPISGVVTDVQVSEGGMAQQYGAICTIESLSQVEVALSLSHYDLEQVKVGQSVTVTFLDKEYTGTVSGIDQMTTEQAGQNGTTSFVGAKVSITNPDENITLGLDATVEINTGEAQDVLIVPTTAINTDVDGTYVMLVENDLAVRRSVETGLSSDTMIEVLSGISEGDSVILSSQDIVEGTQISNDPAYSSEAALSPMMM